MKGINAGILTNAFPLSTEQIEELEKEVLEMQKCYVYLNEDREIVFALPCDVEGIRDLAWHKAYKIFNDNDVVIKKLYVKTGLKTYSLSNYKIATNNYTITENEFGGLTYRIGGTK